jgi:hypothetical protein
MHETIWVECQNLWSRMQNHVEDFFENVTHARVKNDRTWKSIAKSDQTSTCAVARFWLLTGSLVSRSMFVICVHTRYPPLWSIEIESNIAGEIVHAWICMCNTKSFSVNTNQFTDDSLTSLLQQETSWRGWHIWLLIFPQDSMQWQRVTTLESWCCFLTKEPEKRRLPTGHIN